MVNGVSTLPVPGGSHGVASDATPAAALAPNRFVTGAENRLLAAVLNAWCEALAPGDGCTDQSAWQRLSSPLVLVGATGSGKSHLAAGLAELAGGQRAVVTPASDLRRDFNAALDAGDVPGWRHRLSATPLVVLDDVDHLPTRGNFQVELLYLARELEARGHKLIVTSARPIAHLGGWLPELVNWFAGGLTLEISPLGSEARSLLFDQLAESNRWQFTAAAGEVLHQHISHEPREVFRLVNDLKRQFGPAAHLDSDTLGHFLARRKSRQAPELRDIVRVVARYYQLPLKSLTSASRQATVVSARGVAIHLARTLTSASYEQIGRVLGGRNHTTVMHSNRQVEGRLTHDPALRSAIEDLTRLLRT